jgi:hypothetical protein
MARGPHVGTRMAAIMALIFMPAVLAIVFTVMSNFGHSPGTTVASVAFVALALGMCLSLFKMARRWEDEKL